MNRANNMITMPFTWEGECHKLMKQNKQLQEMLRAGWEQLDASYRITMELQSQNSELMTDLETLEESYHTMKDERDEAQNQVRSLNDEISELRQRNNALDSQFRFSSSQMGWSAATSQVKDWIKVQ